MNGKTNYLLKDNQFGYTPLPDPELAGQRSALIRKESAFSGKSEESMIPKKGDRMYTVNGYIQLLVHKCKLWFTTSQIYQVVKIARLEKHCVLDNGNNGQVDHSYKKRGKQLKKR